MMTYKNVREFRITTNRTLDTYDSTGPVTDGDSQPTKGFTIQEIARLIKYTNLEI